MKWSDKPFSDVSNDDWLSKVQQDLKGKSIEDFLSEKSISSVNPIKTYASDTIRNPKRWRRGNTWITTQTIEVSHDKPANNHILHALKGGVQRLVLSKVSAKTNFEILLQGVIPDYIEIGFDVIEQPEQTLANFEQWLSSHAKDIEACSGNLRINPFYHPLTTGDYVNGGSADLENALEEQEVYHSLLPGFGHFEVNGSLFAASGAENYEEMAFSLAQYNELLQAAKRLNKPLSDVASNTEFAVTCGPNVLKEASKLRAFRWLLNSLHNQIGVKDANVSITAMSACFYNSALAKYNNLVRQTLGATAAAIAGVDRLDIGRFDKHNNSPREFSYRLARNIQLLLKEESFMDKVSDPAQGSRYIEAESERIANKAWNLFMEIEDSGGFIAALETGIIQDKLKDSLDHRFERVKNGTITQVGVNKYTTDEVLAEVLLSSKNVDDGKHIRPLQMGRLSEMFEKSKIGG